MPPNDDSMPPYGGWPEYRRLILAELEGIKEQLKEIHENIRRIELDLLTLKLKAGMWGAIAGALPALITALVIYMKGSRP